MNEKIQFINYGDPYGIIGSDYSGLAVLFEKSPGHAERVKLSRLTCGVQLELDISFDNRKRWILGNTELEREMIGNKR